MKKIHFYSFMLAVVLCLFIPLFALAQTPPPVIAYVSIDGAKSGQFRGNSTAEGHEGKIECIGFRYAVTVPHDIGSGHSTGRRQHSPLVIVKNIDYSTPQFLQSAYSDEVLKTMVIEFFKKAADGRLTIYYKITLTNASISQISQYGGTSSPDGISNMGNSTNPAEEITLTFQNITIEHLIGNTSAVDNWRN
jgi:type VI secretion system secreted protein Hcp